MAGAVQGFQCTSSVDEAIYRLRVLKPGGLELIAVHSPKILMQHVSSGARLDAKNFAKWVL